MTWLLLHFKWSSIQYNCSIYDVNKLTNSTSWKNEDSTISEPGDRNKDWNGNEKERNKLIGLEGVARYDTSTHSKLLISKSSCKIYLTTLCSTYWDPLPKHGSYVSLGAIRQCIYSSYLNTSEIFTKCLVDIEYNAPCR